MNEPITMQSSSTQQTQNELTEVPQAVLQEDTIASCEVLSEQSGNELPVEENCMTGLIPAEDRKKITVPCVYTMTKYLFEHYRLCMYSYLNRSLRSGLLRRITGIQFTDRIVNKQVCKFDKVAYWRIDHLNFWADVSITLHLKTAEGYYDWQGVLSLWFSAENSNELSGTVEMLSARNDPPDREGLVMLSPYLIPYLTSAKVDTEMENLWKVYVPGALSDIRLRKAHSLARAMGLSICALPLYRHQSVDSILFLIDDTVQVAEGKSPVREEHIPARTIVINTNAVRWEYSEYNIFHECVHYHEHYLFFCLQKLHHNDALRMESKEIEVTEEEARNITNPIYWLEKQANRGAYGLMMPRAFMQEKIMQKGRKITDFRHMGDRYEKIGLAIAEELRFPHFRLRARMIQLGHIYAKGALNYVNRSRIQPFCFDEASLRAEEHTFVIDIGSAGSLYERNADFKKLLDSGHYIYADGHIVRNDPRFVEHTDDGSLLTAWANEHVDQCCLRFIRLYDQENLGKYIFGRMNYDPDYVTQTMFYLEDMINQRELDEIDAELEYKRNFPRTFAEAFDMLMRKNGDTRESMAEKLNITDKTLYRWLKDPDGKITADFVVTLVLIWRLPDWISSLLLDRAYIHLSDTNRRHLALQYILKVLWSEGVGRANSYLVEKKLDCLSL